MSGNTGGSISQDITGLIVGRAYDLSFDLSGNPDGGPTVKTLNVSIGSESVDFTYDVVANGTMRAAMNWVTEVFSFTAAAPIQTLTFTSLNNTAFGPALDNVRIAPQVVPLPAAMWLMTGAIAGLGVVSRRRRKAA